MADDQQAQTLEVIEAQPELFALADVAGYGALSRREQLFVGGLLVGKTRAEAARDAGVAGSDENVRTAGSRLAAKPRVAAVIAQAWSRSGAKIEHTLAQAEEIAARASAKLRDATDPKERAQLLREWTQASTLKASILGKLKVGIDVAGAVAHVHLTPDEMALMEDLNRGLIEREGQRLAG